MNRKYDLCIITPDMGAGGTQRVLMNLINNWIAQGRKLCVVTFLNEKTDFFKFPAVVSRESIDCIGESKGLLTATWNNCRRIKILRSLIKRYQPKLVLSFLGVTNVLTIVSTFFMDIPVVISERSDPSKNSLGVVWNKLRYCFYRYAYSVTANSRGALAALEKFVDVKKLKYLPNPIFVQNSSARIEYNFPVILAVGRLSYEKGHDILLAAFSKFISHYPQWRLVIVGDGESYDKLKQLASTLNIDSYVIWCGTQSDVFAYYNTATIFVLPSRFEGMPNVLLEAMGCGLPVIVNNASPGPLEFVENEKTGLVVSMEDVDSLSAAMCRLAGDPLLQKQLGQMAQQRIEAEKQLAYELWDAVLDNHQ